MVFQLRRKILSTRSHYETSPDEEVNDSVLLHCHTHSRERDEESCRADEQVEDAGITWLQHCVRERLRSYIMSSHYVALMDWFYSKTNCFLALVVYLIVFFFHELGG